MSRERPPAPPRIPVRQFAVGSALVGAGIFIAVTREAPSEWLIGTLVGLGLLAIGVALPSGFPWNSGPPKDGGGTS